MLLITPNTVLLKSPGIVLVLAMSISISGVTTSNNAVADSHAMSQPESSALDYESALTGYKSLDGSERRAWKESNDTVGKIGGWRSYANEAYKANQAEARAKSESEDLAEGDSKTASDIDTPDIDTNGKHLDSAAAKSENTEVSTAEGNSQTKPSARTDSQPLAITYQSAMTEHRLYDDNPPGDWKAANDRVGEIGGWRTYAQRAYEASKLEAQAEAESGNSQ